VRATDGPGDKAEAFERFADLPFWHVTTEVGTYDICGVWMAPTIAEIEEIVSTIRGYDCADQIDFIVVADRRSDLEDYYRQEPRETDEN